MTTGDNWERVEEIYLAALECDAADRPAFVAIACGGDDALRSEVESLLAAAATGFMQATALDAAAQSLASCWRRSMVGRKFGPYEITSLLGAGGMGQVYRARDPRLDREVAIKILPDHLSSQPQALARFGREAKAVAAITHPNILAIYDFGIEDSTAYAVMELLEGESLRAAMTRRPLGWRVAVDIAVSVAEGLAAAHARGIAHRDIKPENIFLTSDGLVKVLDFGLARWSTPSAIRTHGTESGIVLGTVGYMSPEQISGEETTFASDIFSLACVLHEMISGQPPFARGSQREVITATLAEPAPPLTGIPEELGAVVVQCLAKDGAERFPSVRSLIAALKAVRTTTNNPAVRLAKGSRAAVIAAVAFILLGGAAFAYFAGFPAILAVKHSRPAVATDSLAVLPLVNGTGEQDIEFLSDGITEGLINRLSQIRRLKVMARSTVFSYKNKNIDVQEVGRRLNVKAILSGRVVKRGQALVIQTELVNARDGTQFWGEQYSRTASEMGSLPEEIARKVVESLHVELTPPERARVSKRYTNNTAAYHLYLRGRSEVEKYNQEAAKRALADFKQATDLDPLFAVAYAGLSDAYYVLSNSFLAPDDAMPKARAAALRALEIDEDLAEAHASLAVVRSQYDWNWAGAEQSFRRAIELNPGYSRAHHMYGIVLMLTGRSEQALAELERAVELDPLSSSIRVTAIDPYLFAPPQARNYDRAIAELHNVIAVDPGFVSAHLFLGLLYTYKGMRAQAFGELTKARNLENTGVAVAFLGHAHAAFGDRTQALAVIAEMERRSKTEHVSPFSLASIYLELGDLHKTFECLERAFASRDEELVFIKVDPRVDKLRSDPHFVDILHRMGLDH